MNDLARSLLAEINWSTINHAFGPASDVPAQIEQLCSRDKKTRDHAAWELFGNIVHQGTVYEASAPAARVLLDLIDEREHLDRPMVMFLLYAIATGKGHHRDYNNYAKSRWTPAEFDQVVAREREWVEAAHSAIRDGLKKILMMLKDGDPAARDGASFLLSAFPEDTATVLPVMIDAFDREQEMLARIGLIFAISTMGRDSPEVRRRMLEIFDGNGLPAFCAAFYFASSGDETLRVRARGVPQKGVPEGESVPASLWLSDYSLEERIEQVLGRPETGRRVLE